MYLITGSPSLPRSVYNGLHSVEPDPERDVSHQPGMDDTEESGEDHSPKQSQECLHYLKTVQNYQVKMIAIRVSMARCTVQVPMDNVVCNY